MNKEQKTITVFDAFEMGKLSFKNGLPEVPYTKMGFLQTREFLRGWNSEYLANKKYVKEKEDKKSNSISTQP